ncbi:hypothetical protein D3C74_366010 [compost metagenome]
MEKDQILGFRDISDLHSLRDLPVIVRCHRDSIQVPFSSILVEPARRLANLSGQSMMGHTFQCSRHLVAIMTVFPELAVIVHFGIPDSNELMGRYALDLNFCFPQMHLSHLIPLLDYVVIRGEHFRANRERNGPGCLPVSMRCNLESFHKRP